MTNISKFGFSDGNVKNYYDFRTQFHIQTIDLFYFTSYNIKERR